MNQEKQNENQLDEILHNFSDSPNLNESPLKINNNVMNKVNINTNIISKPSHPQIT